MLKAAIAFCALLFVAVTATPFRDCGNENFYYFNASMSYQQRLSTLLHFVSGSTASLTAVRVPGCNALPCVVYRGTNVSVQYDFIAGN